ncbi:MPN domain-containing protein [Madurella fahalii]|uniref:MPN domain-containing protein n=1 Tax=Madurella fahalii TaxID=1157608 RepID=A0ABQ0GJC8_9PEZI
MMSTTMPTMFSRPMSAKELTSRAKEFDWNPRIGLKYWIRAAETIYHEGIGYFREGNISQAYLVLFRYSILVLEYLGTHPEAKEPEARRALRPHHKRIPRVIEILESLRPDIEYTYDKWLEREAAQRDAAREARRPPSMPYERHAAKHAGNGPSLFWNYNILDAKDHQDLAVDMAKEEMRRRRREMEASEDQQHKRQVPTYSAEREMVSGRESRLHQMNDDELRRKMEETRRHMDLSQGYIKDDDAYGEPPKPSTYHYPSFNKPGIFRYEPYEFAVSASPPTRDESPRPKPPRPPKETPVEPAPTVPPKVPNKDGSIIFGPGAYLENGQALRSIFLPRGLRDRFVQIAADHTAKGIEMLGQLCGTSVRNALFITHLVIPDQVGTPDTCETKNEESFNQLCIDKGLELIGWIHTHPTQTCFMSSRDLHTHAPTQMMRPESIAIVCAPRHEPSWGIFRLTNPPGLPHIQNCQNPGFFHEHSIDNLYVRADHVYESDKLEFDVCDLRPGHKAGR